MKKIHFVIFISLLLFIPFVTYAVYFASDTVTLAENSKKITDDKTLWAADYGYGGICPNGVCDIGQQFYPVTIYRLKTIDIQKFGEFQEPPDSKQGVEFHKYLKENSFYSMVFSPPASEGGEGCGSPGCMGGRIGDERNIDLDLKTQKYSVDDVKNETSSSIFSNYYLIWFVLIIAFLVIFIVAVAVLLFRRIKDKKNIVT